VIYSRLDLLLELVAILGLEFFAFTLNHLSGIYTFINLGLDIPVASCSREGPHWTERPQWR
jgi:hypothetical protein